jgi:hypothetical protein
MTLSNILIGTNTFTPTQEAYNHDVDEHVHVSGQK